MLVLKLESVTHQKEVLKRLHDAEGPGFLPVQTLSNPQPRPPPLQLLSYQLTHNPTSHPILPMVKDIPIGVTTAKLFYCILY